MVSMVRSENIDIAGLFEKDPEIEAFLPDTNDFLKEQGLESLMPISSQCCIGTLVIGINPAIGSQEELQSFSTQDATVSEEISLVQPEEKQQSGDSLPSSNNAPLIRMSKQQSFKEERED
eukprot:jgi/Picre1/28350/NNA_003756.t1